MNRLYLSIIGLLALSLVVTIYSMEEDKKSRKLESETSPQVSTPIDEVKKNNVSFELDLQSFSDYFDNIKVTPLEGRRATDIDSEEIAKSDKKGFKAGLLLEASHAINSAGQVARPELGNTGEFFSPNDTQLEVLFNLKDNKLSVHIYQTTLMLKEVNRLIGNEQLSRQLEYLFDRMRAIKIYRPETLFEFSLAYDRYRKYAIMIAKLADAIEE